MPDPAPAVPDVEAARKKAEQIQQYQDYHKARPATTMSESDQIADMQRRHREKAEAWAQDYIASGEDPKKRPKKLTTYQHEALVKAQSQKMLQDGKDGVEQTPAGTHFMKKALAETGDLGQIGQSTRAGAQKVLDVTDTTTAKVLGVGAKVATGGDVRGIVQNAAVLGDLTGQAMIANDESIKKGLTDSVARNEVSSDDLKDKVSGFQSAAKGSDERKAAALKTFQSAGTRARDQAELGAYQDLSMKVGAEEYSKDEVLGKAAPELLDYKEGDVVKREDAMHGSTYGKLKRAVQTGGMSTSGKLSDEQKADIAGIQKELDDEKSARQAEHEARNAGSLKGQAKRAVLMQGSKLTDAEKADIERIQKEKSDHESVSKFTEAQLKSSKDQVRLQVEALQKSKPTWHMTDERKAKAADIQKQIDALQPQLDEGRKKLADHRAATKAKSEEFDGQVGDIHARADGGFTRAETAARAAKEQKITDIRTGATAAENFTDKHAGETINHYNRVGGMIDRMEDPAKMEATTSGTIAHYANKFGEHTEDAGKIVGGGSDDARDLQAQGKYGKAAATSIVGIGMESAKIAGAPVGAGVAGDGLQKVLSSGMTGVGKGVQALSADAAAEERERTHSRDVVSGARREELKSSSFVTTRRPEKNDPTIAGALADVGKAFLGADAVKDGIMDAVGLGDNDDKGGSSGGDEDKSEKPEIKGSPKNDVDGPDSGGDASNLATVEREDAPDLTGPSHGDATNLADEPHDVGHDAGVDGHPEVGGGHPGGDEHVGGGAPVVEEDHGGGAPVVEEDHGGGAPVVEEDHGGGDVAEEHADGGAPAVEEEHGGDAPAVPEDHAGGDAEHGGDGPAVEEEQGGGAGDADNAEGDGHDANPEDAEGADKEDAEAAGKDDEGDAHDPRAEEEKPYGDKVAENAQGEAYEMGGDKALEVGAAKVDRFAAAPEVQAKADAPVLHPAVGANPAPGPNPGPATKKQLPWWQRIWRAVKRGARAVGRGVMSAGRAVGRGVMSAGRAVKRGFKSMKKRFRSLFRTKKK